MKENSKKKTKATYKFKWKFGIALPINKKEEADQSNEQWELLYSCPKI